MELSVKLYDAFFAIWLGMLAAAGARSYTGKPRIAFSIATATLFALLLWIIAA